MKNIDEIEIFKRYRTTLKNTSYDDTNREYMTESQLEVVDLDKVKEEYCSPLKLKEPPKSCDALYENNDELFFIEFKNGKVLQYDVRKKIYDTILLFTDIVGCGISKTRENIRYILVYDKEKNKNNKDCGEYKNRNIQESEGFDSFSRSISKLAKQEILRFKVGDFQNYLLKSVHTYTKEEFEEKLIKGMEN